MWLTELFLTIINMSLTASIVICFVLLARLLLKKAPKIVSYVLWAVVLFRLLCPVSVSSDFSLFGLSNASMSDNGRMEYISYASSDTVLTEVSQPESSISDNREALAVPVQAEPEQSIKLISIFAYLWIGGILLIAGYSIISLGKLHHQLIGAVHLTENIYLADHITSPFVTGLFHPKIYLPSSMEEKEQEYIVEHEKHHIKRLDHVVKLLAFAALCLHWFNPFVWAAFVLSGRDMEMSCDEAVMRKMKLDIRADYSASLLSLATGRKIIAGTPLAFGEGDTKGRIKNVLHYKKPAVWVMISSILLVLLLSVLLFTNPGRKGTLTGSRYRVKELLYADLRYSFSYTSVDTAPQYLITSDWKLMEKPGPFDGIWRGIEGLRKVSYSMEELNTLFATPLDAQKDKQQEILNKVTDIYRADSYSENSDFYLVMETRKGNPLLAVCLGEENAHIRWLFELERVSGSYDLTALEAAIEDMSGKDVEYFSIYETATTPQGLLVGFTEGNNMGFATFHYKPDQKAYKITGYRTFSGESLYSMTILEEQGFDHSITVALSSRSDLASVSAELNRSSDGTLMHAGVRTCPAMVVFEWPDTLPEDSESLVDVRFYNAKDEELKRD